MKYEKAQIESVKVTLKDGSHVDIAWEDFSSVLGNDGHVAFWAYESADGDLLIPCKTRYFSIGYGDIEERNHDDK
jgi:hypothetical protein